jgi:hypothetical protein
MNTNLHKYEWSAAVSQTSRSELMEIKRIELSNASITAKPLRLVEGDTAAVQCSF